VSIPRSTLEELLIRDFSRSLHEMDTQSFPDVMQVLAHSLNKSMKAPSLPATPPRLASSTEQQAANQTDASPPQHSESVPAQPPQAATTSTTPETPPEGRTELSSLSDWRNRLREEARRKQEAEVVLEAKQAASTRRPVSSTAPEATVATSSQPLPTPADTAALAPAIPTQPPMDPQERDITAELLGIQAPNQVQETESPAQRLTAAAVGIAGFPVAVWTGLDKLFPEALRSTSGVLLPSSSSPCVPTECMYATSAPSLSIFPHRSIFFCVATLYSTFSSILHPTDEHSPAHTPVVLLFHHHRPLGLSNRARKSTAFQLRESLHLKGSC
jgi:hypothetical protein